MTQIHARPFYPRKQSPGTPMRAIRLLARDSSRVAARASRRASRMLCTSREAALRELWATSRDAWIDVPREARGTTFLRPLGAGEDDARCERAMPRVVHGARMFAVTAHNPMGRVVSDVENARANARMEAELAADDACGTRWRSFGFSEGWREDGFVVAFEDADVGRAKMVALAIRYEQGAIYEYEAEGETRLRRRTVPAAMSDAVEADVVLVVCDPPPGFVG